MILSCKVCGSIFNDVFVNNDYMHCSQCDSYSYISDITGEEENEDYFNSIYKEYDSFVIDKKKEKTFIRYQSKDNFLRRNEFDYFNIKYLNVIKTLNDLEKTVLEVGFGNGDNLIRLINKGVKAHGIDISEVAVNNFKLKYPDYAKNVELGTSFSKQVDIIYCNALFEHLDTPGIFLKECYKSLNTNGIIIIDGLPMASIKKPDLTIDEDISFWKPCHRIIYSEKGLKYIFEHNGFEYIDSSTMDSFNYRVLSLHIKMGFKEIIRLRNSCWHHSLLPGCSFLNNEYKRICKDALKINSIGLSGFGIFKK